MEKMNGKSLVEMQIPVEEVGNIDELVRDKKEEFIMTLIKQQPFNLDGHKELDKLEMSK